MMVNVRVASSVHKLFVVCCACSGLGSYS